MKPGNIPLLALLSLLGACSVKPVEPYSEPPLGVPTAQLRVITNGEVRGEVYAGCQGDSKRLAKAGRFGSDQQANINYPQFPLPPRQIDMLSRFAPKLPSYVGATLPLAVQSRPPAERRCPGQ